MSIKRRVKINIFQKHFSEKSKGGGQLSGAEIFLRAPVTVLRHPNLHRTENQSVISRSRHWQRQWPCVCGGRLRRAAAAAAAEAAKAAAALAYICREGTMRVLVYTRHGCISPPPAPESDAARHAHHALDADRVHTVAIEIHQALLRCAHHGTASCSCVRCSPHAALCDCDAGHHSRLLARTEGQWSRAS